MVATRELGIRLSVKDADVVRRALQGLGTEGQQSLRRIERASKPASGGLKAVNTAAREGQAALHGYAAQAGPLGAVLSSIGPAGLLVGAGLGIAGGAAAFLVGDFAELAERAKVMRESFERMAESRGSNPAQLMREISQATRGTLDEIKSLTVANIALSSGIEPLYKNLGQIIKDTRSISTALGRNASVDIERVISAINKQEQELLDELGIVARAETAYKAYAEQLGTTASKLTDLQKRTAFANLVIGQLREKAEAVGDPINRTAEASQRLGSAWVDLKITLGSMVETGGILDKLASGMEAVNKAIANTQFRGAPGARILPAPPAGTPDPAEVGLFPEFSKGASVSGDSLSVPKRLVELGEQQVSQNAAIVDALSINTQHVQFAKSSEGAASSGQELPDLAALAAIFDGLRSDVPEVSDDPAHDELAEQPSRNFEAETIIAKKMRDIRLGEITDTDELARVNLRWRQIESETQMAIVAGSGEKLAELEQLHADEMHQLVENQTAAKNLADAEKDLETQQRELNQAIAAGIRLVGEFSPTIAELATSIAQIGSGDVTGGFVTGFLTLGSAIQDAQRQNLQYRESLDEIRRATAEAATEFNRIAIAIGGPFKDELLAMQTEAVLPLLRRFQEMRALAPMDESNLTTFREFLSILQDAGTDLSDLNARNLQQLIDPFGMGVTDEQIEAFQRGTIDPILAAFGDLPIDQFVREMFALGTGFKDVAESVTVLRQDLGPLERQIRTQFDFKEISLRSQAQQRFQDEGSDAIGQNRVFRDLQAQLSSNTAAEAALLRRMQRSGVAVEGGSAEGGSAGRDDLAKGTAPAEPVSVPVSVTLESFSVTDFEELIKLPDATRRIVIAWEDAVHINDKYGVNGRRPQHWDDIVRVPGRDARVTVNWEDTVHIKDKYGVGGSRPQKWADVVSQSTLDSMAPIEKKWTDAISIARANLSDFGVKQWSDIVRLERASQTVGGSYSHTPGLSRHQRSWAQVIDIQQSDLSDFGINRWSQMVLLSRESGGLSKHHRTMADIIDVGYLRAHPITIDPVDAFRISTRRHKLRLSDVFDMSELNKIIDSRVAKTREQQRYRDDTTGFMTRPGGYGG